MLTVADLHGSQLLAITSIAAGLGLLMITIKDGVLVHLHEAGSETDSRAREIPV